MGHVRRGGCPHACKRQHHRLDADRHRALAWHVGIATKSLARDLGIGKRTRDIMRAVYVLTIFALVALVLVAS